MRTERQEENGTGDNPESTNMDATRQPRKKGAADGFGNPCGCRGLTILQTVS
jgi:hypothetical protein